MSNNRNRKNRNKFQTVQGGQQPRTTDLGLEEIKIERSGFDVIIQGMEFFFSTSEDHIREYMKLQEDPDAFIQSVIDKSQRTQFDPDNLDVETFDTVINDQKEALRIAIDTILGAGSFDRLYSRYPDVLAISKIMATVTETANKGLEAWSVKQQKEADKLAAEALISKKRNRGE